ncbi:hypothetical protein [Polaribacter marinivivus]|uniref:Uncharacterized protein n=1 Tax=Polaribacter marinivivus TaxID=1524260 RepID=A0ABV8R7B0_9FLAO
MTHLEYFINKTNVYNVPKLNKEQFLHILKIIHLEGKIEALNSLENQVEISMKKLELTKKINKLTKRRNPEMLYSKINFK